MVIYRKFPVASLEEVVFRKGWMESDCVLMLQPEQKCVTFTKDLGQTVSNPFSLILDPFEWKQSPGRPCLLVDKLRQFVEYEMDSGFVECC